MIAFRHRIRKILDRPFFGYSLAIFFTMFSTKVQTVFIFLSNSQTLSKYQKSIENDKTIVPKCERAYGVCKLKDAMIDHYILCVVTFCFMGTLERRKKTCCEKAGSMRKLDLLIKDMNI